MYVSIVRTHLPLMRALYTYVLATIGGAAMYSIMYRESFKKDLVYAAIVVAITQSLVAAGRVVLTRRFGQRVKGESAGKFGRRQAAWMLPLAAASVTVGYFAGIRIGDVLLGVPYVPIAVAHDARMVAMSLFVAFVPAALLTYVFYTRQRISEMELQAEAAQRTAAESQLRLLESHLEPHMLFNTLANLRVLIGQDPPRAQWMLDRLIAYLRATLVASRAGQHTLADEFERIADYLALMEIRMGPRLKVELAIPDDLASMKIPSLLLQPLVENAIKHGLEPKVGGGKVAVSAHTDNERLVLTVRDTGVGLGVGSGEGASFGLHQVRERIDTLYGSAGSVSLQPANDDDGGTQAVVSIPISLPIPRSASR